MYKLVKCVSLVLILGFCSFEAPFSWAAAGLQVPAVGGLFEGPAVSSPAAIFWNPAAIGPLRGVHLFGDFSPTFAYGTFTRDGIDPNTLSPYSKNDWFGFGPIPTLAATSDFGFSDVVFGLGFYVPFGAAADYGLDDLFGGQRFHIQRGSLAAFHTTPSASIRILPNLFAGLGLSWVYTRATTSLSYDLASALSNVGIDPYSVGSGVEDPLLETYVDTRVLSGHSFGWNLGLFFQPTPDWDLGLSYRSEVPVTLTGTVDVAFPIFPPDVGALASLASVMPGSVVTTSVKQHFVWPRSLQAQGVWRFDPRWNVFALAQWTQWSRLGRFGLEITSPPLSQSAIDFSRAKGLRDSVFLAIGAQHMLSENWKVGGRLGFDTTAVPTSFVNPQNVDFFTLETGVGATYAMSRNISFTATYLHQFFIPRTVTNSVFDPRDASRLGFNYANANGEYTGGVDKLDLSVSMHF